MSDFKLPDIGEGIVECEVVEWRVSEGEEIAEDQPVVEVMTDKALVEITAPEAGRVTRLYVAKGDIAKVHAPLFAYEAVGEEPATPDAPPRPRVEEEAVSPAAEARLPPRRQRPPRHPPRQRISFCPISAKASSSVKSSSGVLPKGRPSPKTSRWST
ncbi:biotin/lipoyl-containing protein [Halomonas sp. E19]|uniref:biotin/lipoyl-containing protein n=1 Tax=Halomonas sp. E19 TaxID=3397247 RepID=UPI00403414E5